MIACGLCAPSNRSIYTILSIPLSFPNTQTTTFGTPGVREHCLFLKEIPDAVKLRRAIVDRFERASMPSVPPEEKERILSFVVVGGGCVRACVRARTGRVSVW